MPERSRESLQNATSAYKSTRYQISPDNARLHGTKYVTVTIEDIAFEAIEHSPYSPDLSPCEFWLFPNSKKHLGGQQFHT